MWQNKFRKTLLYLFQGESGEKDTAGGLLDGLEDVISRISSNKDVEETNELLNLDFAQELNFR